MTKEVAFLMAAGAGTRILPLSLNTPKPLIKVKNKPMIETIIKGLIRRGVNRIYVIVGYKKEKFQYLRRKYKNLTLIENKHYQKVNNISSIRAVAHIMKKSNCFVCESDLYIADQSIFSSKLDHSCYYGKFTKGNIRDWVFDLNDKGIITRVGLNGKNTYKMCGISYFKKKEAKIIASAIVKKCQQTGEYENMFWDEVVDENLPQLKLVIHPVKESQLFEIDTINDLKNVDSNYLKYNK